LFCFVFLAKSCLIVNMNGLISPTSLLIYSPLYIYAPHIIVSAIGRVNVVNDVLKEKTQFCKHSILHYQPFWSRSLHRVMALVSLVVAIEFTIV
jgi:hypothetical protein